MTNQDETPPLGGMVGDLSKKPEQKGILGELSKKVENDTPPGGIIGGLTPVPPGKPE